MVRNFNLTLLMTAGLTRGAIHHEDGYGAMTYRVPMLKSDKSTYVLPIPAPEGSHYKQTR